MARSGLRATLAIALGVAPLVILGVACSQSPEQQFLTQFFQAAKAQDNSTLAAMSTASFDPREHGTVESFEITSVSEERRTPLDVKALAEAQKKAKDAEAEFDARKKVFQDANMSVIEAVVYAEQDRAARLTPAQAKVKAEWDKWRAETSAHTKAVAAAGSALASATGPAEASLAQPGQPAFDAAQFQGDLQSKEVVLNAQVRSPAGQVAPKTLTITIQRAVGTLNGQAREGRPIIAKIQGA